MRVRCSIYLTMVVLGVTGAGCDAESGRGDAGASDVGAPDARVDELCPGAGQRACGDRCVDTRTDDHNCGVCGAYCPTTEHCVDGVCRVVDCSEAPLAMCGDECVDTRIHPSHCGGCDRACPISQICEDGECDCPEGVTRCGDQCAVLDTSPAHCGACNARCDSPSRCLEGRCVPCPFPSIWCSGECLESSDTQCGACDRACPEGLSCVEGACQCPSSTTLCTDGCATLSDDPVNCSVCGLEVPHGASCIAGMPTCRPGYRACGETAGNLLVCASALVGDECDDCDGGAACPDGRYCDHGVCFEEADASLVVTCGGGYLPGSSPVQCHAYLTSPSATTVEVTRSPFLTWSSGLCVGPLCDDPSDAPLFGEGLGASAEAGVFTPAGRSDAERVDVMVVLVVSARFARNTLRLDGNTTAATLPAYGSD